MDAPGKQAPGPLESVKQAASIIFKIGGFVVAIWSYTQVFILKDLWLETVPQAATVLTVRLDGFWGPVHALVPTNCTRFATNDAVIEKQQEAKETNTERRLGARRLREGLNMSQGFGLEGERLVALPVGGTTATAAPHFLAVVDGAPKRMLGDDVIEEDGHLAVSRCGKTVRFEQITLYQRYMAMVFLSGHDDMKELRDTRSRMLWLFVVMGIFENFVSLIGEVCSSKPKGYVQIENPESCLVKVCKLIASTISAGWKKFVALQSQLAILSLFFVYWHNDAYLTSFIPGKAYLLWYGYNVVATCEMWMTMATPTPSSTDVPTQYPLSSCCAFFLMPFVLIPMTFGYSWYSQNFLWNTAMAEAVSEKFTAGLVTFNATGQQLKGEKLLETEWMDEKDLARSVGRWLLGVHGLDLGVEFALNLIDACLS